MLACLRTRHIRMVFANGRGIAGHADVCPGRSFERGCLFVFEGLDRAGKTTQASLLAKYLRSQFKVVLLNFPSVFSWNRFAANC
jgi:hypothetical protein